MTGWNKHMRQRQRERKLERPQSPICKPAQAARNEYMTERRRIERERHSKRWKGEDKKTGMGQIRFIYDEENDPL
jgi:hypothetical protein